VTSMMSSRNEVPKASEIIDGLAQPLVSTPGASGLGRWLALTTLAQAILTQRRNSESAGGYPVGKTVPGGRQRLPPLAAEVFGLATSSSRTGSSTPLFNTAASDLRPWSLGFSAPLSEVQFSEPEQSAPSPFILPPGPAKGAASMGRGNGAVGVFSRATGGGLFTAYLASGLEVLREFSARVQHLANSPRQRGPTTRLRPTQVAQLQIHISELQPLMGVVSSGLAGWIALSRDLDESGSVQREEGLPKVLCELCNIIIALESLQPLWVGGALELTPTCADSVRRAHAEATHSIEQLRSAFENAGLREIVLPALCRRIMSRGNARRRGAWAVVAGDTS